MQKSRYLADVHRLRLMSLLNELVRDRGNKSAARVLGIDRRTVAASVRSGVLVQGDDTSESRERWNQEELLRRMKAFEEEMRGAVEAVRDEAVKEGWSGRCGWSSG